MCASKISIQSNCHKPFIEFVWHWKIKKKNTNTEKKYIFLIIDYDDECCFEWEWKWTMSSRTRKKKLFMLFAKIKARIKRWNVYHFCDKIYLVRDEKSHISNDYIFYSILYIYLIICVCLSANILISKYNVKMIWFLHVVITQNSLSFTFLNSIFYLLKP